MLVENIIREKHSGDIEQLNFIFSDEKKIIVKAPAGCGKTTAMVSKIARELSIGNIFPNKKVLAITYSVNAAMKIKDSLKLLLPELVENPEQYQSKVDVANYHNFAMRILIKHGYCINSELVNLPEFKIVDEYSEDLNDYIISEDSNKMNEVESAIKKSDLNKLKLLLDDYWNILNKKLIPNHIITYNGILISAIKLLQKKQISSFYKEYYQMIIVDEFQDTNYLGYLFIKNFIGDNTTIFLGDDIQKIYGFLGAVDRIFDLIIKDYTVTNFKFCNNYRFKTNKQMKKLDLFIRDCAENYKPSMFDASVFLKHLSDELEEDNFIVKGIEKIIKDKEDKVAILLRAGWQGNSIIEILDRKKIKYFNALFKETDLEYIAFYKIALEEFHKKTFGKALQNNLKECLLAVKNRKDEIYKMPNRKYIFDSLYKLLEILFNRSKKLEGTSIEKYEYIDFILTNNGLKHMMEYLDDQVVMTTIHSSKGLEWEYVILPKLNNYAFPTSHMCNVCKSQKNCNIGFNYCIFLYKKGMEKVFKEEMSILYVALTRAKKNVFMTVNTGLNNNNYVKRKSCLVNLKGLSYIDFMWENVL